MIVIIRRFVMVLGCALVAPLAASSQERLYDFSLTFSGLPSVGNGLQTKVAGTVTFNDSVLSGSDLSISAFDGSRISFSDAGYSFTGTLGDQNTFDNFTFSSVVNLPDNVPRESGGALRDNTVRTLDMSYTGTGSSPIFVSSQRYPIDPEHSLFEANGAVQYSFGEEIVDSTTKATLSGNDPVAVPEINGGSLALVLFVFGTLGVYTVNRRKRAFGEHQAIA